MSTLTPPRQFKDDPIQKNNDKPPRPPKPTMK